MIFHNRLCFVLILVVLGPWQGYAQNKSTTEEGFLSLVDSLEAHESGRAHQVSDLLVETEAQYQQIKEELSPAVVIEYKLTRAKILNDFARYAEAQSSLDFTKDLLTDYEGPRKKNFLVVSSSIQAFLNIQTGDFSEAKKAYWFALRNLDLSENRDSTRYYHIVANMANVYQRLNLVDSSLEMSLQAKKFLDRQGNEYGSAIISNNIAETYRKFYGEYALAKEHLKSAMRLNRKNEYSGNLAQNYHNYGLALKAEDDIDSARYYLLKAIQLKRQIDAQGSLASSLNGLAEIEMEAGQHQAAVKLLKESLVLCEDLGISDGVMYNATSLAECYLALGDKILALESIMLAVDRGEQLGALEPLVGIYDLYSHTLEANGNFSGALAAAEKARSINDSLNSISTNDRIIKLKSEYEKDLTLAENAVLEARQAELDEKVSNQQLLLWLSSFFILSLLVLGLSLWRALSGKADAYRQLEKANETLSHKNNVLAQQEAELSAANQRMNRILAVLGHDLRAPLSSLSSLLEATSATEITRQELDYFLKELQKQTDESLNALESVLFWAQSQQKSGGKLKLESIELEPFFEEVIRTYTSGSRSKNIHLRTDITKELALMADRNMLRSMLGNLVSNAIKFTPAGGEISLSANKLDEKIQICVADSGKGMSESQLKQWNQSAAIKSNLGTAGERGTGIGLQLVTDFARLHHAELSFKANEPSGTKACLVFPVNHKQVATIK